jgi:NAD(P)-dependent dehydrogenase (short-subunit alcohol dehydrogenase family)
LSYSFYRFEIYRSIFALTHVKDGKAPKQFDTNFFAPLQMIRSILPIFRAQRSEAIINISSVTGIDGHPICGLHAGTKFVLEGMTEPSWSPTCYTDILVGLPESLAHEVSDFGIRVLMVEPGAFRTRFLQSCIFPRKGNHPRLYR